MKHLKKFESFTINESIPKEPRGKVFGTFDDKEIYDEMDRRSTLDEIGDDYDEEIFYDYDSYSKSKFFRSMPWFGHRRLFQPNYQDEKMFNIYQAKSGGKPFVVRTRK
jgi:hypothetical protein